MFPNSSGSPLRHARYPPSGARASGANLSPARTGPPEAGHEASSPNQCAPFPPRLSTGYADETSQEAEHGDTHVCRCHRILQRSGLLIEWQQFLKPTDDLEQSMLKLKSTVTMLT